jgi:hypothetical protein
MFIGLLLELAEHRQVGEIYRRSVRAWFSGEQFESHEVLGFSVWIMHIGLPVIGIPALYFAYHRSLFRPLEISSGRHIWRAIWQGFSFLPSFNHVVLINDFLEVKKICLPC